MSPRVISSWPNTLGQRFAAVYLQRDSGQEAVGHREQHGVGHVLGCSDAPRGVAAADVLKVVPLSVFAKRVPGAGVDDAGRDRVDPDRASSTASERVRKSTAPLVMATPR